MSSSFRVVQFVEKMRGAAGRGKGGGGGRRHSGSLRVGSFSMGGASLRGSQRTDSPLQQQQQQRRRQIKKGRAPLPNLTDLSKSPAAGLVLSRSLSMSLRNGDPELLRRKQRPVAWL